MAQNMLSSLSVLTEGTNLQTALKLSNTGNMCLDAKYCLDAFPSFSIYFVGVFFDEWKMYCRIQTCASNTRKIKNLSRFDQFL